MTTTTTKTRQQRQQDAIFNLLKPALGRKIVSIATTPDDEPTMGLVLDDGTIIWALRDAEGNGAGWLEVEKRITK